LDAQNLLALYDLEERIRAQHAGMQRDETTYVIRHVPLERRSGYRDGFISYSRLAEPDVAPAIDQQVRFFDSLGLAFEWKVYSHDTPPDLRQRLATYGFEIEESEAIMALVLEAAPPQLLAPVRHDVRLLDDPDQLDDYIAVQRQVWQKELAGQAGDLRDTMIMHPELIAVYVAYDQGEPVASARLFYDGRSPFASLWGGSTLASHRKQGFYTALLAVRAQEAIRRGAQFLTIDASPMSRPIVARFGFQHLATAYACNWRAKAPGAQS
jgi:GNAT superfamily N-acetyltransferase